MTPRIERYGRAEVGERARQLMMPGAVELDGGFDLADLLPRPLYARPLEPPGYSPDDRIGTNCQKRRCNESLGECEAVLETHAHGPTPACSRTRSPSAQTRMSSYSGS